MSEIYADLILNNDVEQWLLDQGAQAYPNPDEFYNRKTGQWKQGDPIVVFSGRRIFFYTDRDEAGNKLVRVFFNEETQGSFTLLAMKWPHCIKKHNVPVTIS